jgi:hypothetical protein
MRILFAILLLLAATGSAAAADLTISAADCRALVAHIASDDTAFRPGIDVDGAPVAPAGAGSLIAPPDAFTLPITIDLQRRLGVPANPDLYGAKPVIGTVVYRNGHLWFDGQRLAAGDEAALSEDCRKALDIR